MLRPFRENNNNNNNNNNIYLNLSSLNQNTEKH